MKLTKNIISRFNKPSTLLVISKYPFDGVSHSHHGVATYTAHLLHSLINIKSQKVVLLVENEFNRKIEIKENGNLLIIPSFNYSLMHPYEIIKMLSIFPSIKLVHIHSEYLTSGNPLLMAELPLLILMLRMMRKKVMFYLHNVVTNVNFLADHLGRRINTIILKVLELLIPTYYFLISILVSRLIVLEEQIAKNISRYVNKPKIFVSPHWVFQKKSNNHARLSIRKKLGLRQNEIMIMSFGFVSKYKGADWLIKSFNKIQKKGHLLNSKLIIAGGKSPSQEGKRHYEQYYLRVKEFASKNENVKITGFIPEKQVSAYFNAADLIVLPYSGILGASGSWAHTLAHCKPFLLSRELAVYLNSNDCKTIAKKNNLNINSMVFDRNIIDFEDKISRLIKDRNHYNKVKLFSKTLAHKRSAVARLDFEYNILFNLRNEQNKILQWKYYDAMARAKKIPDFAN